MKKYKNVQEYIDHEWHGDTRDDMKDLILRTSLDLLSYCGHNFEGDPQPSEHAAFPLLTLNEILDSVE